MRNTKIRVAKEDVGKRGEIISPFDDAFLEQNGFEIAYFRVRRVVKNSCIRYRKTLWTSPNLSQFNNYILRVFETSKGILYTQNPSGDFTYKLHKV